MKRFQQFGLMVAFLMLSALTAWALVTTFTVNVRAQKVGACEIQGSSKMGLNSFSGGRWYARCTDGGNSKVADEMEYRKTGDGKGEAVIGFEGDNYIKVEGGWNEAGLVNPQVTAYKFGHNSVEDTEN